MIGEGQPDKMSHCLFGEFLFRIEKKSTVAVVRIIITKCALELLHDSGLAMDKNCVLLFLPSHTIDPNGGATSAGGREVAGDPTSTLPVRPLSVSRATSKIMSRNGWSFFRRSPGYSLNIVSIFLSANGFRFIRVNVRSARDRSVSAEVAVLASGRQFFL